MSLVVPILDFIKSLSKSNGFTVTVTEASCTVVIVGTGLVPVSTAFSYGHKDTGIEMPDGRVILKSRK
jgi:hypothetical protein